MDVRVSQANHREISALLRPADLVLRPRRRLMTAQMSCHVIAINHKAARSVLQILYSYGTTLFKALCGVGVCAAQLDYL